MRKVISLLVFAASLHAGEQINLVTSQSLNGWTATGADVATMAQPPHLAIPAGAQLTRSFSGTSIVVKLVTQPVFGLESADWPVLEIGSVALAFTRSGDNGKLALVLGDGAPVILPFAIKLTAEGHTAEPIGVTLARSGSTVTVSMLGQTLLFVAEPVASAPQDVIVSAGASQAWPFDTLAVIASSPDETAAGGAAHLDVSAAGDGLSSKKSIPRPAISSPSPVSMTGSDGATPAGKIGTANIQPTSGKLEIFTPPAVRHGRASAIRAALAQRKEP